MNAAYKFESGIYALTAPAAEAALSDKRRAGFSSVPAELLEKQDIYAKLKKTPCLAVHSLISPGQADSISGKNNKVRNSFFLILDKYAGYCGELHIRAIILDVSADIEKLIFFRQCAAIVYNKKLELLLSTDIPETESEISELKKFFSGIMMPNVKPLLKITGLPASGICGKLAFFSPYLRLSGNLPQSEIITARIGKNPSCTPRIVMTDEQ